MVTDESGAVIPGAKVAVNGPKGIVKDTMSASDGSYSIVGLAPGDYTLAATAPDLVLATMPKLQLRPGVLTLNVQLKVASTVQQVTVEENTGPIVTPDPANNATALVLRGEDLQMLADDPDDLANDLQALAGPAAGPNGGSIYIDGFSGGQLPSKDSIREIRVNQNPFSPEFDRLGFGRIEIFTKPGTDKFHGSAFYNYGGDAMNSRNPYSQQKGSLLLQEFGGNLGGPINRKSSFFMDVRRDAVDNSAIVNAIVLNPTTLAVTPYTAVPSIPQRRLIVNPRVDYQLSTNNTLVMRYTYGHTDIPDAGIGSTNLLTRGFHSQSTFQLVQATETAVLKGNIINEIRFQFFHIGQDQLANNNAPGIAVLGSFSDGGSSVGHSTDLQKNYEFQDYVSIAHKAHSFKFGARLRGQTDNSVQMSNFNGSFTFGGGLAPVLDSNNQIVAGAAPIQISSIERYRRTLLFQNLGYNIAQIQALGGGATQYSVNAGTPGLSLSQMDAGLFAGDDWRVRPNITLSLGLRYEMQTNIRDKADFAPRIGIAWAPGVGGSSKGRPKTVIRGGFGMFYDRFALGNVLAAQRYNGVLQQQYVVTNPLFYLGNIPSVASLAASKAPQTIQEIDKNLQAPYIMQSAVSVERQLPKNTTVAVTYANSHGLHSLRSVDINAPVQGTYNPNVAGSGVYPFGSSNPVLLEQSSGLYNQNQLIFNTNSRVNANISLFGNYMFSHANSNTDGLGTTPGNPYNYRADYGPAATDIHHRMTIGGSLNMKWNVRLSPFIILESGAPFDITTGRDLFGTTLFNSRPGIATDATRPGVIQTAYGLLDPNPTAGEQIIGRNYGRGPGQVRINLRVAKTFGFGPVKEGSAGAPSGGGMGGPGGGGPGGGGRGPGGGNVFGGGGGMGGMMGGAPVNRRFALTVSMSAQNLINHNNPGPITGNLTSPLFGQANQIAGGGGGYGGGFSENANNRRLELQLRLTF
jgi:hypothetical protein